MAKTCENSGVNAADTHAPVLGCMGSHLIIKILMFVYPCFCELCDG